MSILKLPELDSHTLHSYQDVRRSGAKAALAVNYIHIVKEWAYCTALALSFFAMNPAYTIRSCVMR